MSKQFTITLNKVMANQAATIENLGRHQLSAGQGQPLKIQASNLDNAYYQLADAETGLAPEKALFKRVNDDLHISFEEAGAGQTDLIIENYYTPTTNGQAPLVGMQQNGALAAYPEIAAPDPLLAEQVMTATQPASGSSKILAVLGGIAGAGLLGAAAGGGGGGGGSPSGRHTVAHAASAAIPTKSPGNRCHTQRRGGDGHRCR